MTLEEQVEQQISRMKITAPEGVQEHAARKKVKLALLTKLVGQAMDAGVVLNYQDWLQLSELERAMWEQAAAEKQQGYWALFAAACGNTGMARKALHLHDDAAQINDAIEIGLARVGL